MSSPALTPTTYLPAAMLGVTYTRSPSRVPAKYGPLTEVTLAALNPETNWSIGSMELDINM